MNFTECGKFSRLTHLLHLFQYTQYVPIVIFGDNQKSAWHRRLHGIVKAALRRAAILFSNSTRADMDEIMGWKDGTWNIFTYYYLHFYIIQWDTIYYIT